MYQFVTPPIVMPDSTPPLSIPEILPHWFQALHTNPSLYKAPWAPNTLMVKTNANRIVHTFVTDGEDDDASAWAPEFARLVMAGHEDEVPQFFQLLVPLPEYEAAIFVIWNAAGDPCTGVFQEGRGVGVRGVPTQGMPAAVFEALSFQYWGPAWEAA
jgi:hypothetical protein